MQRHCSVLVIRSVVDGVSTRLQSCTHSDEHCNLSRWTMSETVFKKGGCSELRNDRSLMMWLLGPTDVKILTRAHSVRTQGTDM